MQQYLAQLNKAYWQQVPANKTTSLDLLPSEHALALIPDAARVLDIGSGDGQLAELFAEKGFSVCAIDINPHAIDACKEKSTSVAYSTQDITQKTTFEDGSFDLLSSKYTLANVHRSEWDVFRKEVERLVAPGGYVWLAEPLVSPDYEKRYALSEELLQDEYALFVFTDSSDARKIDSIDSLQDAIDQGKVSRISRHYTREDLLSLFPTFDVVQEDIVSVTSPSGFEIHTFVGLLQKKTP